MKKLLSSMMLLAPLSLAWLPVQAQLDDQGNDPELATGDRVKNTSLSSRNEVMNLIEPKFGTNGVHLHTSWSSDCDPINSDYTYGQNFGWRYSTTGSPSWFDCTVDVPQGAELLFVGVEVIDNDADDDVGLYLIEGDWMDVGYTERGRISTAGRQNADPLYLVLHPSTSLTADYAHNTYMLRIQLAGDFDTKFRGVFAAYRLQVSPAPATASFTDVPTDHWAFQGIEALAASGITRGCGGSKFCPDDNVTRAQMAVFLSKALGLHWW